MAAPAVPYQVLYDGGCGLCLRTVTWLRRLDLLGRLQFVDVDADWERLAAAHRTLDRDACLAAMHVIAPDGGITAGFDGFRTIARVVPPLWMTVPFLYLPGVAPVGRRIYRYVAVHRRTTCRVPTQRPAR